MIPNFIKTEYLRTFDSEVRVKYKLMTTASKRAYDIRHSTTQNWLKEIWIILGAGILISFTGKVPEGTVLDYFFGCVVIVLFLAMENESFKHQKDVEKLPEYKAYHEALRSKGVKV